MWRAETAALAAPVIEQVIEPVFHVNHYQYITSISFVVNPSTLHRARLLESLSSLPASAPSMLWTLGDQSDRLSRTTTLADFVWVFRGWNPSPWHRA